MKSKKIKKIVKEVLEESRKCEAGLVKISTEVDWCEYDPEVSERFKKMILNLSNYKNNINISIDFNRIGISTSDITSIKSPNGNSNYKEDHFVEMSLVKDKGFTINYGYRFRSNYKDEKLFDEIQPILVQRLKEINSENFNEIWTELMKGSGILRDINLEELSNG